jgi:hypothetical protein
MKAIFTVSAEAADAKAIRMTAAPAAVPDRTDPDVNLREDKRLPVEAAQLLRTAMIVSSWGCVLDRAENRGKPT